MKIPAYIVAISGLLAAPALAATINTNIPGTNPPTNLIGVVGNLYQFALLTAGLLAFGAITYGGLTYILSAGNPEKQSIGKDHITQALLGLVLLLGAGILLNLINPQILSKNPNESFTLKDIDTSALKTNLSFDATLYNPNATWEKNAQNDASAADKKYAESQDFYQQAINKTPGPERDSLMQQSSDAFAQSEVLRLSATSKISLGNTLYAAQQGNLAETNRNINTINSNYNSEISRLASGLSVADEESSGYAGYSNEQAIQNLSADQFNAEAQAVQSVMTSVQWDSPDISMKDLPDDAKTIINSIRKNNPDLSVQGAFQVAVEDQVKSTISNINKTAQIRTTDTNLSPFAQGQIEQARKKAVDDIQGSCQRLGLRC